MLLYSFTDYLVRCYSNNRLGTPLARYHWNILSLHYANNRESFIILTMSLQVTAPPPFLVFSVGLTFVSDI